jgi:hypothetical protein
VGEAGLIGAVGVHRVDFEVFVPVGREEDPLAVGEEGRVACAGGVLGPPREALETVVLYSHGLGEIGRE